MQELVDFYKRVAAFLTYCAEEELLATGTCFCCRGMSDAYMLGDEVWEKAAPEQKLFDETHCPMLFHLCFGCVEKRLKRPLRMADFIDAPVNTNIFKGYSLAQKEINQ